MIDEKPERKSQGVGKSSLKRRPNPDPSVAATGASERTRPSICYVPCKSCWLVAGVTYKFAKALPNSIVEHDCNDCRILQGITVGSPSIKSFLCLLTLRGTCTVWA